MSLSDRVRGLRDRAEDLRDRFGRFADAFDALADRRFAFAERDDRAGLLLAALLLGHVIVWTLQPTLAHGNLADSVDMVENWTWGKEWQWGYWKHPPLFAWVTAAWFSLLPRADWAYYLLAAVNAAVGLAGVWAMAGVVDTSPRRRLLAVAGLAITPVYGFLALKFNANAILLAVWPWTAWAFLRALASRTARDGAVLGLLLALAMLSKYVSAVIVLGMIVVILADRDRWALLRSPAAVAATLVGLAAFLPHVVWMVATDFRTVTYAEHLQAESVGQFFNYLLRFPLSLLLFLTPMIAAVLVALPRHDRRELLRVLDLRNSSIGRRRVVGLAVAPIVAMIAIGTAKWVRLSSQWGFPLVYAGSWLLVSTPGIDDRRIRLDRVALLVALVWAGLIATAPVVNVVGTLAGTKVHVQPRTELGREVTTVWHEVAGPARLAALAGTFDLAHNVDFYSPDAPSVLINFDWTISPWLTPESVAKTGIAVICASDDAACEPTARRLFGEDLVSRDLTVAKSWFGLKLRPLTARLLIRLPAAGG